MRYALGCLGVLACMAVQARLAGAAPSQNAQLNLPVSVYNNSDVSAAELAAAQAQASEIYASIGITIQWGNAAPDGLHLVIVRSAAAAHLGASDEALGLTPATLAGPGRRGYVFEDRIRATVRGLHMAFGALLGCAMAHELGHMLLPLHAHSDTGIMRASWDAAHLSIGTTDYLHFSPWQERMIRQKLLTGR